MDYKAETPISKTPQARTWTPCGCLCVISEWIEVARRVETSQPLLRLFGTKWGSNRDEKVNRLCGLLMLWRNGSWSVPPAGCEIKQQHTDLLQRKGRWRKSNLTINWVYLSCFENDTSKEHICHTFTAEFGSMTHTNLALFLKAHVSEGHDWLHHWFINNQRPHKIIAP